MVQTFGIAGNSHGGGPGARCRPGTFSRVSIDPFRGDASSRGRPTPSSRFSRTSNGRGFGRGKSDDGPRGSAIPGKPFQHRVRAAHGLSAVAAWAFQALGVFRAVY